MITAFKSMTLLAGLFVMTVVFSRRGVLSHVSTTFDDDGWHCGLLVRSHHARRAALPSFVPSLAAGRSQSSTRTPTPPCPASARSARQSGRWGRPGPQAAAAAPMMATANACRRARCRSTPPGLRCRGPAAARWRRLRAGRSGCGSSSVRQRSSLSTAFPCGSEPVFPCAPTTMSCALTADRCNQSSVAASLYSFWVVSAFPCGPAAKGAACLCCSLTAFRCGSSNAGALGLRGLGRGGRRRRSWNDRGSRPARLVRAARAMSVHGNVIHAVVIVIAWKRKRVSPWYDIVYKAPTCTLVSSHLYRKSSCCYFCIQKLPLLHLIVLRTTSSCESTQSYMYMTLRKAFLPFAISRKRISRTTQARPIKQPP
eukprot:SAG22_NODE_180_length_16069_cov_5.323231_5_plen_369_part_00